MLAKLYIPYLSYDEKKSFTRFVPENQIKNDNMNIIFKENDLNNSENNMVSEYMVYRQNINNVDMVNLQYKKNDIPEITTYASIDIELFNINGQDETLETLLNYFRTQEQFINIIQFNTETINDDGESELKLWLKSSYKIQNTNSMFFSEDQKLLNLPLKTFKLIINDNAKAYLENCKLIEIIDNNCFAMIIDKINFFK
jgi:hypothetical protein